MPQHAETIESLAMAFEVVKATQADALVRVHTLVEQAAIVEVYASECRTPIGQKPSAVVAYGPEIVPQGALDQPGQRFTVQGGSRLGFANQAVVEVQGRFHTEMYPCYRSRQLA